MEQNKSFISKHPVGVWALISICVFSFIWYANSDLAVGREKPYVNVWSNYIVVDNTTGPQIEEPGATLHVISSEAPVSILDLDSTTDWLTMDFRRQGQRTASFGVSESGAYGGNAFVLGSYKTDWTNPLIIEQGAPTQSLYIKSNSDVSMTGNLTVGKTVKMSSISGTDGMIENVRGGYLHIGGWGVGRTDATAVLVNTAYTADYATQAVNADKVDGVHESSLARNTRGACRTLTLSQDNWATCNSDEFVAGVRLKYTSNYWYLKYISCCKRR